MTRNNYLKTTKAKLILILTLIGLMCFSLFFTACAKEEPVSKEPTYSYTETDDGVIKNTSFAYGTVGSKYESFPKTSITGWTLSKDSSAKSGVISTTDDAWKELINALYNDSGILNYVKEKEGLYTTSAVNEAVKAKYELTSSPTSEQTKKYFTEEIIPNYFANPKAHASDLDSNVYMLNNYKNDKLGAGSVQKLTSATTITLDKGEFAKVSVWAKTINLDNISGKGLGANIRITNTFNGTSQAPFGIFSIDTKGEWKNYTFYIQADEVYDTTFTLVLGLGFEEDYVEGTVYFDDITVEKLETVDSALINTTTTFNYNSDVDAYAIEAKDLATDKFPLYNLSFNLKSIEDSVNTINFTEKGFTTSTTEGVNGKRFSDSEGNATYNVALTDAPYGITNGAKIEVKNASYTVKSSKISLASESYATVTFFVKNCLSNFYATTITFDVYDVSGAITEKRPAVTTITEVNDEWTKCSIQVKNNFDRNEYTDNRDFFVSIVVGPTDVKSAVKTDYAYGEVYITKPILVTGKTYKYENDADKENDVETANYKYYQFLNSTANGSTSLYAGRASDFVEESTSNESYNLAVSASDIGTILTKPATPKNYNGIVANHYYINEESNVYAINTNSNAGLINSKYLSTYKTTYSDIETALGYDTTKETNIQPLMIYNKDASSYGYIGNSYTLSASSYAKVSLDVRVYDNATAYIYIVDASKSTKNVMTFEDFTVNAMGKQTVDKGTEIKGEDYKLAIKIDSETVKKVGNGGWVNVQFYVASGASAKNFRVEMWNGARDESAKSQGYVFFNNVNVSTSASNFEPDRWQNAFDKSGNPLFDAGEDSFSELIMYQQELTEIENQWNREPNKPDIAYDANYVWAKNDYMIYAVYNTIDAVEVNPYENEVEEDKPETEETQATDPSTFWLSFSSILLGVVLVLAIIALFIKNFLRRRRRNASDAKSHYTIVSRTKKNKREKAKKEKLAKKYDYDENEDEIDEDAIENVQDEQTTVEDVEESTTEETLDSYVYGEVQDFGEEDENK